jgi:hypothetical protein
MLRHVDCKSAFVFTIKHLKMQRAASGQLHLQRHSKECPSVCPHDSAAATGRIYVVSVIRDFYENL